jgi:hypothetical protein
MHVSRLLHCHHGHHAQNHIRIRNTFVTQKPFPLKLVHVTWSSKRSKMSKFSGKCWSEMSGEIYERDVDRNVQLKVGTASNKK